MQHLATDVRLLLAAGGVSIVLGFFRARHTQALNRYTVAFGVLFFAAGLRYTGAWH